MVLIYFVSGDCIEVEDAVKAEVGNGSVLCFDRRNRIIATFPAREVETYTANPVIADVIKDEACEETSGMPAAGVG